MELGIADVYAQALYGAATDLGHVDEVRQDIEGISEIISMKEQKDFRRIMVNPAISADAKKRMIEEIFGGKVEPEVLSFLCILVDKGRMYNFQKIVREYGKIVDDANRIGDGEVWSAVELTEQQIEKLSGETGQLLGKKVRLANRVDPSLLGGVKIFIDGKLIDASVSSRLEKLSEQIRKV